MKSLMNALIADQEGGTLVEYILLISLVALVCVAGITLISTNLKSKLETVSNTLN
ncbi:MAG: Flp family type IVb pilin [Armatimonadetes bacterium]|nr:Flp family type IVb pilin [Armatimonadota bacterium]